MNLRPKRQNAKIVDNSSYQWIIAKALVIFILWNLSFSAAEAAEQISIIYVVINALFAVLVARLASTKHEITWLINNSILYQALIEIFKFKFIIKCLPTKIIQRTILNISQVSLLLLTVRVLGVRLSSKLRLSSHPLWTAILLIMVLLQMEMEPTGLWAYLILRLELPKKPLKMVSLVKITPIDVVSVKGRFRVQERNIGNGFGINASHEDPLHFSSDQQNLGAVASKHFRNKYEIRWWWVARS